MGERTPAETTFLHFLARYGRQRFPAYSRGHSLLSSLSDKRTVPALTGAEADAAACLSHGRRFSLLPLHPQAFPLRGPQGDRCPNIPAALAATYPLRCFAPQWARFDNRHSTSAPDPTLAPRQRQQRERFFVSDGDSFAPRRERFLCLRRPHFFQQRKKWGKERRQKLRFCTSSARYACSLPPALSLT